jgi:hypothetical protein
MNGSANTGDTVRLPDVWLRLEKGALGKGIQGGGWLNEVWTCDRRRRA